MAKAKKTALTPEITSSTAEDYTTKVYRDYGLYTLEERAIPSAQDGLLPVQRRILFSMYNLGLKNSAKFAKCAMIVGDTMGKYHPHGDAGIYGALVNMTNPDMHCKGGDLRAPILPQGNFGVPRPGEGKPARYSAAAMRYTEAKLSKVGTAIFDCLNVADMIDNFDGTRKEPRVIPSRVPLLLMMGCYGVALGANTIIPPHHPIELLRAARYMLRNPDASLKRIMTKVKGPDYGHSSMLSSKADVLEVYRTGKGTLRFMCDHHIERGKDCHELVISSMTPGFLMAQFLNLCKKLEDEGKILACNDATDSRGPRLIVQFKDPTVIEERIIPKLRTHVSYNWNVVDKSGDKDVFTRINIMDYLSMWLDFRRETDKKVLLLEKDQAFKALHREQAKLAGIQNIAVLAKILSDPSLTEEQSNVLIKKKVKLRMGSKIKALTDDQVTILLDQKIKSLRALNLKVQVSKIKDIIKVLKRIKANLEDPDSYLEQKLIEAEGIFPKGYKRGMALLNGVLPKLEMPKGESSVGFWNISDAGFVRAFQDLPQRKGKWYKQSYTIKATPSVVFVESAGKAHTFQSVYLAHGKSGLKSTVVGACSDNHDMLLVMDESGSVGIVDLPLKKQQMIAMKTDKSLVFAAGVGPDDTVLMTDGKKWVTKTVKAIGSKRPNSNGVTMLRSDNAIKIYVIPKGGKLIRNGEGPVDFDDAIKGDDIFAVAPKHNWVVDVNNVKKIVTASEAASIARDPGILHVSTLR